MSTAQTKFTVRMAPEALAQIDVLRAQHGFSSRAAFLEAPDTVQRMASISDSEVSYRRMVDENLVRKSVSFAEMANLARSYAIDPCVGAPGMEEAIRICLPRLESISGAISGPLRRCWICWTNGWSILRKSRVRLACSCANGFLMFPGLSVR